MKEIKIFCAKNWSFDNTQDKTGYELLDTGVGEKLERFGLYTFVRPYEDAIWPKSENKEIKAEWSKVSGKFWSSKEGAKAGWKMSKSLFGTKKWEMGYGGVKFFASPTPFRHLSFFPEQAYHWEFIEKKIAEQVAKQQLFHGSPLNLDMVNERNLPYAEKSSASQFSRIKFLNLFGYTGVASLFALKAGAEVTHVDASKQTLELVKENQKLNSHLGLEDKPMRIILDDALKFLEREEKRGNRYDAVIMDPPKFGRGPKGEIWKIEKDLEKLLLQVRKILSDKPLFVILNSYAIDSSSLSLGYALESVMKGLKGEVSAGELCLLEKSNSRTIPLSNTAIWEAML
jgi:23S rRNA (cytosine1962-C5)-methyltransferase